MHIVEIHDKDIISFPSFPSTKLGQESKWTKTKTFVFVEALKRAAWNVLTMGCVNFFLEFFFGGVSPSYLRGFWIHGRLAVYAASLLWPKQDYLEERLAMPHVVLWRSWVCRGVRLECRIVTVVQTVHLKAQMSLLLISRSLNKRNAMKGGTFSFNKF